MDYILNTLENLWNQTAFTSLDWKNYIMILVALLFLYLAIKKGFEPLLLVPIAFGMLLVNIYPDIMAKPGEDGSAGGVEYLTFIDFHGCWCDDRLRSAHCQSEELPLRSRSSVRNLCSLFHGNLYGIQ